MACESGQVRKVSQMALQEWSYLLRWEDNLLECKLSFTAQSVSGVHCACGCHSAKNPCIHAWTLAFWHMNYKDRTNQSMRQELRSRKKLVISDLQNKSHAELVDFISIALKFYPDLFKWSTLLLPSLPKDEAVFDFYLNALAEFDQNGPGRSQIQTIKVLKTKLIVLDQLYEKSMQYYLQGEMERPFYILLALVVTTYQWLRDIPSNSQSKFNQKIIHYTQTIHQLIKTAKAPDLRVKMFECLIELIGKYPNHIIHRHDNLWAALFLFTEQRKRIKDFEKTEIPVMFHKAETWTESIELLWFLYHQVELSSWTIWIQKDGFLENINPMHLIQFCREISDRAQEKKAHDLLKLVYANSLQTECRQIAIEGLLGMYIQQQQVNQLIELSAKAGLDLKQLKFIKIWKEASGADMTMCEQLALSFRKSKNFDSIFYYRLLTELRLTNLLLREFEKETNLANIMQFDGLLLASDPDSLLNIYLNITKDFLTHHLGTKAFAFVEKIKNHFIEIKERDLERKFTLKLNELFPDRISLFSNIDKNQKIEI